MLNPTKKKAGVILHPNLPITAPPYNGHCPSVPKVAAVERFDSIKINI